MAILGVSSRASYSRCLAWRSVSGRACPRGLDKPGCLPTIDAVTESAEPTPKEGSCESA